MKELFINNDITYCIDKLSNIDNIEKKIYIVNYKKHFKAYYKKYKSQFIFGGRSVPRNDNGTIDYCYVKFSLEKFENGTTLMKYKKINYCNIRDIFLKYILSILFFAFSWITFLLFYDFNFENLFLSSIIPLSYVIIVNLVYRLGVENDDYCNDILDILKNVFN